MMVYICIKFHENNLNSIRVMEQNVNGQTDRRTDGGQDIIRPVFDGRIKMKKKKKINNNRGPRKAVL